MTTVRKLTELFRAIAHEDLSSANDIASQLWKLEEKKGHRKAARVLRGALNGTRANGAPRQNFPTTQEPGLNLAAAALVRLKVGRALSDVILAPAVQAELESLIAEWNKRATLQKRGIEPRSKLLFHGPPGCGKSLTALALGNELGLPVYMVRFDAVIGAFLGQTAIHLRQLFHFAETTPCVLLLDELDALGKKRGNPLDVGELDRIVISLLQELEHSRPLGLIVGTTNLSSHLDDALWRRFDMDLKFNAPQPATLRRFAAGIARRKNIAVSARAMKRAMHAPSFAEAEKIVIADLRRQLISSPRAK
jgi:ATP-dependent Zn protease